MGLESLIDTAGLMSTLDGDGQFTLFAPINRAFENLPSDVVETITGDETLLTNVLTYHVLPCKEWRDSRDHLCAGPGKFENRKWRLLQFQFTLQVRLLLTDFLWQKVPPQKMVVCVNYPFEIF